MKHLSKLEKEMLTYGILGVCVFVGSIANIVILAEMPSLIISTLCVIFVTYSMMLTIHKNESAPVAMRQHRKDAFLVGFLILWLLLAAIAGAAAQADGDLKLITIAGLDNFLFLPMSTSQIVSFVWFKHLERVTE